MELSNYKKRFLIKNEIFITYQNCREDMFVKKYYETKNLLYLCVDCFEELAKQNSIFLDGTSKYPQNIMQLDNVPNSTGGNYKKNK